MVNMTNSTPAPQFALSLRGRRSGGAPRERRCGEPPLVRAARAMSPTAARYPLFLDLGRILHVRNGRELDIVELAVLLLDLADIDVLDDVAGVRIDRDRAARALPLHPLHGCEQLVAVGIATRLLQRFIDQVDAVISADRHEAR